jgi:hypothetical protein
VGVGAAFALAITDFTVDATLGANRALEAATLDMRAIAQNDMDTNAPPAPIRWSTTVPPARPQPRPKTSQWTRPSRSRSSTTT